MGGPQSDGIFGNGGNDDLYGEDGNDWIECGAGTSACLAKGGSGDDMIIGGGGPDYLYGDAGSDFVSGGSGDISGNDHIYGGTENDYLFGFNGVDHLYGEGGNDVLSGGLGTDIFFGSTGVDTFYCRTSTSADPFFDPADADTDCSEHPTFHGDRGMETTESFDPYVSWVRRFLRTVSYGPTGNGNRYDISVYTTSSATRLETEDYVGATILYQAPGEPLYSRRIQSDWTCGPQSLEMVLRYLGYTEEQSSPMQLIFTREILLYPFDPGSWESIPYGSWYPAHNGVHEFYVSVGYRYSVEHIVLDALAQRRWFGDFPPTGRCGYLISGTDELNNLDHSAPGDERRISYLIAGYDPLQDPPTSPPPGEGPLQTWDFCSPGVGMSVGDEDDYWGGRGLAGVANRAAYYAGDELDAEVVSNGMIGTAAHFEAIVAGFIDHDLPLVVGVERGGHFNTIVGYWDLGSIFYLYTADPLDGGLRNYPQKPMRWQRFVVNQSLLDSRVVTGLLLFGHVTAGGCDPGGWAEDIDNTYGPLLCN